MTRTPITCSISCSLQVILLPCLSSPCNYTLISPPPPLSTLRERALAPPAVESLRPCLCSGLRRPHPQDPPLPLRRFPCPRYLLPSLSSRPLLPHTPYPLAPISPSPCKSHLSHTLPLSPHLPPSLPLPPSFHAICGVACVSDRDSPPQPAAAGQRQRPAG